MKKVAKAIAAFLLSAGTAIGTWAGTLNGPITTAQWVTLGGALLGIIATTLGVYSVRNAPAE